MKMIALVLLAVMAHGQAPCPDPTNNCDELHPVPMKKHTPNPSAKHMPKENCRYVDYVTTGGTVWSQCLPTDKEEAKKYISMLEQQAKEIRELEDHRRKLVHDLTTKVLSPAEMTEVLEMGWQIFVTDGVPFREEDIHKEFSAALDTQIQIRKLSGCGSGER